MLTTEEYFMRSPLRDLLSRFMSGVWASGVVECWGWARGQKTVEV